MYPIAPGPNLGRLYVQPPMDPHSQIRRERKNKREKERERERESVKPRTSKTTQSNTHTYNTHMRAHEHKMGFKICVKIFLQMCIPFGVNRTVRSGFGVLYIFYLFFGVNRTVRPGFGVGLCCLYVVEGSLSFFSQKR